MKVLIVGNNRYGTTLVLKDNKGTEDNKFKIESSLNEEYFKIKLNSKY